MPDLSPLGDQLHPRVGVEPSLRYPQEFPVIILGVILIIVGILISIPVIYYIGIVLAVVGLILTLLGAVGRGIGGRKTFF